MEWSIKIKDEQQEIILQIGNEKFLLSRSGEMPLAMSKEESERLIKTLSLLQEEEEEEIKNTQNKGCNFHIDCQQANEIAKSKGKLWAEHCSDECCEDCFGT